MTRCTPLKPAVEQLRLSKKSFWQPDVVFVGLPGGGTGDRAPYLDDGLPLPMYPMHPMQHSNVAAAATAAAMQGPPELNPVSQAAQSVPCLVRPLPISSHA
jgi:hypothetical protein